MPDQGRVNCSGTPVRSHRVMNDLRVLMELNAGPRHAQILGEPGESLGDETLARKEKGY